MTLSASTPDQIRGCLSAYYGIMCEANILPKRLFVLSVVVKLLSLPTWGIIEGTLTDKTFVQISDA